MAREYNKLVIANTFSCINTLWQWYWNYDSSCLLYVNYPEVFGHYCFSWSYCHNNPRSQKNTFVLWQHLKEWVGVHLDHYDNGIIKSFKPFSLEKTLRLLTDFKLNLMLVWMLVLQDLTHIHVSSWSLTTFSYSTIQHRLPPVWNHNWDFSSILGNNSPLYNNESPPLSCNINNKSNCLKNIYL